MPERKQFGGSTVGFFLFLLLISQSQKPGDHPNFRKNALGVKRPFSELWERSGVSSEQRPEFRNNSRSAKSHSRNGVSRLVQCDNHNSQSNTKRFPEVMGTHMKDFHLPLRSRNVFSKLGVAPAKKSPQFPQTFHRISRHTKKKPNLGVSKRGFL